MEFGHPPGIEFTRVLGCVGEAARGRRYPTYYHHGTVRRSRRAAKVGTQSRCVERQKPGWMVRARRSAGRCRSRRAASRRTLAWIQLPPRAECVGDAAAPAPAGPEPFSHLNTHTARRREL